MPPSQADDFQRNIAGVRRVSAEAAAEEKRREKRRRLKNFFRREREKVPFTAREPDRRGDLTVAALGVTLGLICALFPWYIFYNPEQFGVRAVKFRGNGEATGAVVIGEQPDRVGAPSLADEVVPLTLDLFPTGTAGGDGERPDAPGLSEQPFPAEVPEFRLIHVENGRAMIADDVGIFVVQRGGRLPDGSRVAAIEEREGAFVLITDEDRVIAVSE